MHRMSHSKRSVYWLGQYPIYLMRGQEGWYVRAPSSCASISDWLKACGLWGQCFKSRKDAASVMAFALQDPDSPAEDNKVQLSRKAPGVYQTKQGVTITRSGKAWSVNHANSNLICLVQGSLWHAGWVALFHSLRLSGQKTPGPSGGLTLWSRQEISVQKALIDGVDRPSYANDMLLAE
jgi:hypothetical protein